MDEAIRRLERDAQGEGGSEAALRLARSHVRAGQADEALICLANEDAPAALALKAEVLLGLDRIDPAADAAGDAMASDPESVSLPLREALRDALLGRLEVSDLDLEILVALRRLARVDQVPPPLQRQMRESGNLLAKAQIARAPSLRAASAADPSPLVRAVAGAACGAPRHPDESVPTRLFSAHGPDFESGTFVAFEASCEDRLCYFDATLFAAVAGLLGHAGRLPAFGRGYGLAIPRGDPVGDLDERVKAVNAARALPFPLAVHAHQPFDVLEGDEPDGDLAPIDARLAWRFAQDLARHPARIGDPSQGAPYARVLSAYRGGNPSVESLSALMERARAAYGPVGVRALQLFGSQAQRENQTMADRRAGRL